MKALLTLIIKLLISYTLASEYAKQSGNELLALETKTPPESDASSTTAYQDQLFSHTGYPVAGDIPVLNRKVFRARRVSVQEHPYAVSIRRNYSHYLTGSLIRNNLVVSVAHPLKRAPVHDLGVVLGQNYNDRGTAILTVILVFIHRRFNPNTLENDVALLRFYETIDYNSPYKANVKEIPIATPRLKLTDKAHITGWGRCDMTGKELCLPRSSAFYPDEIMDPMLRSIKIDLREVNHYCEGYTQLNLKLSETMLCAGQAREEYASAPCLAVPGAALVAHGRLLGVASWGFGCGYMNDLPLIYTDIRKYNAWILAVDRALEKISWENFTQIYQATKAYAYYSVLKASRRVVKKQPRRGQQLVPLALDWVLMEIVSTSKIYDVRNYIDSMNYHEKKKMMYSHMLKDLTDVELDFNLAGTTAKNAKL